MLYRHEQLVDRFKVAYDSSKHKLIIIEKKLIFYAVNFIFLYIYVSSKNRSRDQFDMFTFSS